MGQIIIKGVTCLFDDADHELVEQYHWHLQEGCRTFYLRGFRRDARRKGQSMVYMHRLIMRAPKGLSVDHVNGTATDNRRENLRFCTQTQNNANRHHPQTKTSPNKGVHFESQTGRWRAEITSGGQRFRLGRFNTSEEAASAYLAKAVELFGEFANPGHSLRNS